ACAANPAAADQEVELSKLRAKIEAGASVAQTPPGHPPPARGRVLRPPPAPALPVLVGVLPPPSLQQPPVFSHQSPRAVVSPPAIQDRMRRAAERGAEHERAEGLAIARELAAGIAKLAPGIHVMPMGKYKIAGEILEALPRGTREGERAQV